MHAARGGGLRAASARRSSLAIAGGGEDPAAAPHPGGFCGTLCAAVRRGATLCAAVCARLAGALRRARNALLLSPAAP